VGKYGKRRPLGRPTSRWKDKIYLREIMIGGRRWNKLAKHREKWRDHLNTAISIWVT